MVSPGINEKIDIMVIYLNYDIIRGRIILRILGLNRKHRFAGFSSDRISYTSKEYIRARRASSSLTRLTGLRAAATARSKDYISKMRRSYGTTLRL